MFFCGIYRSGYANAGYCIFQKQHFTVLDKNTNNFAKTKTKTWIIFIFF